MRGFEALAWISACSSLKEKRYVDYDPSGDLYKLMYVPSRM